MKMHFAFVALFLASLSAWGQLLQNDRRVGDLYTAANTNFGRDASYLVMERLLLDEQLTNNQVLQRAKFYLMQGQVELARYELSSFDRNTNTNLGVVVLRYRAVADFLQGRWDSALGHLQDPFINRSPHFAKICTLKVLSMIAVRSLNGIQTDWQRCQGENPQDASTSDMVWMDTLVRLVASGEQGLVEKTIKKYSIVNLDNETLIRVMKLALYLNVEALVVDAIDGLDITVARDEELRALMAHILFRQGRLARAWRFIEGDTGVNAENIRGNIWLLRGNLEIAFGHFNLALKLKNNSHNAAERALPIAWTLKQWKRGQELTQLMDVHERNVKQIEALATAFDVQLGDFAGAKKRLDRLDRLLGAGTVLEVDQLATYVGLITRDTKLFLKHGQRACDAGDMTACWTIMAQMTWEDLTPLLTLDAESAPKTSLARTLASTNTAVAKFEEEEIYVDQRDIDELDEGLIQLIKK